MCSNKALRAYSIKSYNTSHKSFIRVAALISHIPWVLALLGFVPGSDKGLRKLQEMAKQCADRRIQAGSSCKDLFYYLVSHALSRLISTKYDDDIIDRRRTAQINEGSSVRCW